MSNPNIWLIKLMCLTCFDLHVPLFSSQHFPFIRARQFYNSAIIVHIHSCCLSYKSSSFFYFFRVVPGPREAFPTWNFCFSLGMLLNTNTTSFAHLKVFLQVFLLCNTAFACRSELKRESRGHFDLKSSLLYNQCTEISFTIRVCYHWIHDKQAPFSTA